MRSASGDDTDLTGRARIRDAAIRRFGTDGFGASVRAIAAEAGVSAALVIHHFGSKDGLRAACDDHVLRMIREGETDAFASTSPVDLMRQWSEIEEYAPLVGYLIQALLAGGDLARALLERMTTDAEEYLAEAVAAGRMKPSRDPAARAAYLVDLGVGSLLAFIRRNPPPDGDHRVTLREYARTRSVPALELYTEGLLTDSSMLDAYLKYLEQLDDPSPEPQDRGNPA